MGSSCLSKSILHYGSHGSKTGGHVMIGCFLMLGSADGCREGSDVTVPMELDGMV